MDYKTAKSKREAAADALTAAKQKFKDAQQQLQDAKAESGIKYETLTTVLAQKEAEEATPKDVQVARKAYKRAQQAIDDAKIMVDTKAKAITLFERKKKQADRIYEPLAYEHYRQRGQKIVRRMQDAVKEIESINADSREFRQEMAANGLNKRYVPHSFEYTNMPTRHISSGYTLDEWAENIRDDGND